MNSNVNGYRLECQEEKSAFHFSNLYQDSVTCSAEKAQKNLIFQVIIRAQKISR